VRAPVAAALSSLVAAGHGLTRAPNGARLLPVGFATGWTSVGSMNSSNGLPGVAEASRSGPFVRVRRAAIGERSASMSSMDGRSAGLRQAASKR
jgi:hypothetical protein